jgi:SAM-dependent MidA family methyltransferase
VRRVQLIEAGAHDGQLALDILRWLCVHQPARLDRVEYVILEASARRRAWQERKLAEFPHSVRWIVDFRELSRLKQPGQIEAQLAAETQPPQDALYQIIFANELLDAFPVHRLGWDARRGTWFEWGVTVDQEQFAWTRMEPNRPQSTVHSLEPQPRSWLARSPERLLEEVGWLKGGLDSKEFGLLTAALPDGYTIEVCPAATQWWDKAARALSRGKLLTFDYGFGADELFQPERSWGTLRGYDRHRVSLDVLARPGDQDLTTHVNFGAVQTAGEAAGLVTECFERQGSFLTRIAAQGWINAASDTGWTAAQKRQFHTLTHPEHLGRCLRVLVQSRPGDQGAGGDSATRDAE